MPLSDPANQLSAATTYNRPSIAILLERAMFMAEFSVEGFENSRHDDGTCFWDAREFMRALGYESWQAFQSVITKAMGACTRLEIDPTEAFIPSNFIQDGQPQKSYRLSRFACFLVAMSADSKKPESAKAKAVLAAILDRLVEERVGADALGRIEVRHDLTLAERVMSGVAQDGGLRDQAFAIFKDAGFRGMYNMSLRELKSYKGIADTKAVMYDFMGLEELAGNLFRVTQTAARIKSQGQRGSDTLAQTAKEVGGEVRRIMVKNSGVPPEELPISQDIKKVKSRLRSAAKKMKKIDLKK